MIRIFLSIALFISTLTISAQKDSIDILYCFRITDYTVQLNDSTTIVQISKPELLPLKIKDKQLGILKYRYENGKIFDTTLIGAGRCNLIKGEWHYFSLHLYHDRKPEQGDLLYSICKMPKIYTGVLFNIARNDIRLTKVDEAPFYSPEKVFKLNEQTENAFIDSMAKDIRYTGKEMLAQNDGQDQIIKDGIYNGKKLFAAMLAISREDVIKFLKYMAARPQKYAGNVWKISELFATWMTSETPMVIEH